MSLADEFDLFIELENPKFKVFVLLDVIELEVLLI